MLELLSCTNILLKKEKLMILGGRFFVQELLSVQILKKALVVNQKQILFRK